MTKAAKKTTSKKTVVAVRVRRGRPKGRTAGSMTDQIDTLEPGRTLSLTKRFELGECDRDTINAELATLRGTLGSLRTRVNEDSDGLDMRSFKMESGVYLSDDKTAILVTVALTRTE